MSESRYSISDEMNTLFTGQVPRASKSGDDVLKFFLGCSICRLISDWFCFNLMGEIVCSSDNIPFLRVLGW
jgi:hypothetical protein